MGDAMNERLKELAEQAGFDKHHAEYDTRIERFANLVRQDEREACAVLCEEQDEYGCGQYAKAIRARSEQ
jgi:hypothetical protein